MIRQYRPFRHRQASCGPSSLVLRCTGCTLWIGATLNTWPQSDNFSPRSGNNAAFFSSSSMDAPFSVGMIYCFSTSALVSLATVVLLRLSSPGDIADFQLLVPEQHFHNQAVIVSADIPARQQICGACFRPHSITRLSFRCNRRLAVRPDGSCMILHIFIRFANLVHQPFTEPMVHSTNSASVHSTNFSRWLQNGRVMCIIGKN